MDCFGVETNEETHEIIRSNLDRAPMYNGGITSAGPRYCPSIETKIVRFAEKDSHHLFLEPEGWHTREIYVQGANTSLPEDVQLAMLRSIPALRHCEIMRAGYAIEYDYLPGVQVYPTLESKPMRNLFLAGQIIGTTGYEEAGSLGIMAGINAARRAAEREPVVLRRDEAYIGVLIDDLVTKEMDEPYRMHTSQAEFRLLLRQDNAEARLSGLAHRIGLIDDDRFAEVERRRAEIGEVLSTLETSYLKPDERTNAALQVAGVQLLTQGLRTREFLMRDGGSLAVLQALGHVPGTLVDEVVREIETQVRYAGYVARQEQEVERLRRLEGREIPESIDYLRMHGMRSESRERLQKVRPRTVGQAARIAGVAPSDVSVLLVHLEREGREVPVR
jgi:tRNA uridine 5-carboxymethylaminomethyl modification enzyme